MVFLKGKVKILTFDIYNVHVFDFESTGGFVCLFGILNLIEGRLPSVSADIITHTQANLLQFVGVKKFPLPWWIHGIDDKLIATVRCHIKGFLVHPLEVNENWFFQVFDFEFNWHPLFADPAVLAHGRVVLVELHAQPSFVERIHH